MKTNLKKMALMIMTLLLAPSFLSAQVTEHPAEQNGQELNKEFVANAQAANLFEIDAAKVALERSKSPQVQAYAQRILNDRSKRSESYTGLITQKMWQLPQVDVQLYNQQLQKLEGLEATEFDNEYLQTSLRNQTEWLSQTQNYNSNEHADKDLKNLLGNHVSSYKENMEWIKNYKGNDQAQPKEKNMLKLRK